MELPQPPSWITPIRVSLLCVAFVILAIVWMSYGYTAGTIETGLALLASPDASEIKDGVIQLLTAVVQNMVALTAVGGLIGVATKLVETG